VKPFPTLSEEAKERMLEEVKDMHLKGMLRQKDPANPGIEVVDQPNARKPI
jgi:hypothetical protein